MGNFASLSIDEELKIKAKERMHEERETNDSRFVRKCIRYYLEDTERPEVIMQEIADLEAVIAAKREKLNSIESAKAAKEAAKVMQENTIEIIPIRSIDEIIETCANAFVEMAKSKYGLSDSEQESYFSDFADQASKEHSDLDKDEFIQKLKKRITEIRVNKG